MKTGRRSTLTSMVGFHGCDRSVAERVLGGEEHLHESDNHDDWLGNGVYFWLDNAELGYEWAKKYQRIGKISEPSVVGAYVDLGLSLWTSSKSGAKELQDAHSHLQKLMKLAGKPLPRNSKDKRMLDCAVISTVHQLREDAGLPPYDAVCGIFEGGAQLYQGSGFRKKSHIQVALRNLDCVVGYFRVPEYEYGK